MKTEAEVRVVKPQARSSRGLLATARSCERPEVSPGAFRASAAQPVAGFFTSVLQNREGLRFCW